MVDLNTLIGGEASGLEDRVNSVEQLAVTGTRPVPGGPVAAATTGNITLSGEQTIDGVTTSGSRVLVKDQSDAAENGIYVSASGAWSRATDMNAAAEVRAALVYVDGGTTNGGRTYFARSTVTTLGTDDVNWTLFSDQSSLQSDVQDALTRIFPDTAYSGLGGEGDRREILSARAQGTSAEPANLIDGSNATVLGFSGANDGAGTEADRHIYAIEWPRGSRVIASEITVTVAGAFNNDHGTFAVQMRNRFEEDAWTEIEDILLDFRGGGTTRTFALPVQSVLGVAKGFDSLRLYGKSGSFSSVSGRELTQIDLKIGLAADHQKADLPVGGTAATALLKNSADLGDTSWQRVSLDHEGSGARRARDETKRGRVAGLATGSRFWLDGNAPDDAGRGHKSTVAKQTVAGLIRRETLSNGDFAAVSGQSGVYEITLTRGATAAPPEAEWAIAYVAASDPIGRPNQIERKTSIADVAAASGAAYFVENPRGDTATAYVRGFAGNDLSASSDTWLAYLCPHADSGVAIQTGSAFEGRTLEFPGGVRSIVGAGEGELPVFECSEAVSSGAWSAATGNLYSLDWEWEDAVRMINDPEFTVFEVETSTGRVFPSEYAEDKTAANAKPGRLHVGVRGDDDTAAGANDQLVTLFYRPRGDTFSGKTIRIAKYKGGIGTFDQLASTPDFLMDSVTIEGVIAQRQVDGHGSIVSGDDARLVRCGAAWGPKHNLIIGCGTMEDTGAFAAVQTPRAGPIPITVYRDAGPLADAEATRLHVIWPDYYRGGNEAVYCHDSGAAGGTGLRNITLHQPFVHNGGKISTSIRGKLDVSDYLATADDVQVYTSVSALNAVTGSDRDYAVVIANNVATGYVWNGALATPEWEETEFFGQDGFVQIPHSTVANPDRYGDIRRGLFFGIGIYGLYLAAPAGYSANTENPPINTVEDCVFHLAPGSQAAHALFSALCQPAFRNNLHWLDDYNVRAAVFSAVGGGLTWSHNIVINRRETVTGISDLVNIDLPSSGPIDMDYNVYILAGSSIPSIRVDGTQYRIDTEANWQTYLSAMASDGIDQNSIRLTEADIARLFSGDPATHDYRLRVGDLKRADGSPLEFGDGSPVNSGEHRAGPRQHLDWRSGAILDGAPFRKPTPPRTYDEWREYLRAPALWDWYA
ncbi:hypothetical protein ROJ8625_04077 [Roseivivax jejudonensis]|uniref:Uncharacterized protein n=1 Tax=Roseivivax jejudonensis TaxID=1529041 RepID=A0A1X7AB53_9RHOB|nr:hypothetical protein [Roseivivax jejudonensis]SLN74665.1 hypothetical protein ROJ8625_04077 [Roseivivax jejudonensis]